MTAIAQHHVLPRWWRLRVIGQIDHQDVIDRVHDDAGWSPRYLFNITMSAAIAILGLLLSSPAVVIGAMLISPLMGPIIGLGFAIATADAHQIKRAAIALVAGSVFAILFCAALVLISPLQNVTSEIAARTRPNLFDLAVALFSALAGSYATIRGRAGTIVGVAIATALMPPLATIGFGLATWNGTVFGGASLLFVTNFVTIALTATVMARLYGFGSRLSPQQTLLQTVVIVATLAALAIPLGLSLRRIAFENVANAKARSAVDDVFGKQARVSQISLDFHADPIAITATVLTPRYRGDADQAVATAFAKAAGRPATASIEQYRVGTGPGAADEAAVRAAQAPDAVSPDEAEANDVVDRLALVAGADPAQIWVDRENKRVRVGASVLPGATLAAYHLLEMRVAAAQPGWTVTMVPPAVALPPVTMADGAPDEAGRAALAEAIWGARRLGLAIGVAGAPSRTAPVVAALTRAGVDATRTGGGGGGRSGGADAVALSWRVAPPPNPAPPLPTPTPTPTPAPRQ